MGNWDLVSKIKTAPAKGTVSTDALTTPSEGKNTPPKQNNFQKFFGDVSDDFKPYFEWDDIQDRQGNDIQDVFDNALNGHYKAMMVSHGPKSGFINDQFKNLGEAAWGIARHIQNGDKNKFKWTSQADADKYEAELGKLREDFYKKWNAAQGSVYMNTDGMPRGEEQQFYFTADARLQTARDYKKANHLMVKGEGAGSNIATTTGISIFGAQKSYAVQNANGAFNHVEMNDAMDKEGLRKTLAPIVGEWVNQGLTAYDSGATSQERVNNRWKTMSLVDDMVGWVAKHGSPQNKELKKMATQMQNEMKLMDYGSKKEYILNHVPEWTEMVNDLGFYGSQHLYTKHQEQFNDSKYYPGVDEAEKKKSFSDSRNLVTKRLQLRKEYLDTSKRIKNQALLRLQDQDGMQFKIDSKLNIELTGDNQAKIEGDKQAMIYSHLLHGNGKIRSFKEVMTEVRKAYGKNGNLYNSGYFKTIGYYGGGSSGGGGSVVGASSGGTTGKSTYRTKSNKGYTWTEMKNAYTEMKKAYKESFGKIDMKNVSEYTSMVAGLGYRRSEKLKYESVDFNMDNPKTDNVNKIRQMVTDQDFSNNVRVKDIFISTKPYKPDITEGYIKNLQESGDWSSADQHKFFRNFFKDPNKENVYDVEFSRESPLRGKSAYTFTNKNTGKQMTIYASRNLASKYKEKFVKDTFTSSSDWSFNVDGVWDMTWAQGKGDAQKAKNLQIVNNEGFKYLSGSIWDPNANDGEGGFTPKYLKLRRSDMLNIRDAEIIVIDYLNNIPR